MSKLIYFLVFLYSLLPGLWLPLAYHYYKVLEIYAEEGLHVSNPTLYIAVESWLLICFGFATLLYSRVIEMLIKYLNNEK